MIGPLTYLDAALIAVCFISGLLAMYRGFAREVLSILSWLAAAAVGAWIFFTKKDLSADIAVQTSCRLAAPWMSRSISARISSWRARRSVRPIRLPSTEGSTAP